MNIVVYRPGCAARRTVFENQLCLYDRLQVASGYRFHIIVDRRSYEPDSRFLWTSLEEHEWEPFRGRRFFLNHGRKLSRLIERIRGADRIVTLDPTVYPQAHLAFEAARKLDIPVWFDSTITLLTEKLFSRWNRLAKRRVLKDLEQSERILIPTPKVLERFLALGLLTDSICRKTLLLGHPIDTDLFKPCESAREDKRPPKFLCISRMTPEKGIAYILEGFLMFLKNCPDATLTFVGNGLMAGCVEQFSRGHYGSSIFLRTVVDHAELPAVLREFNYFLAHPLEMPNWEEYFGVSTLEAMAAGLPCITTMTGGIGWVLRGAKHIVVVNPRDVAGMTLAIKNSANLTGEEYMQISKGNREYVKEMYDLVKISDLWAKPSHQA